MKIDCFKAFLTCLLIIGLNQSFLLQLATFEANTESEATACACLPTSCMCPPSNGCEHKHPGEKDSYEKKQISICQLNACDRQVAHHSSGEWKVPVLTRYIAGHMPYPAIVGLEIPPDDFASQQYLTPPDKPPQKSIHS